jgi:putative SOS response-associated peptidase YedK
MCGRFTRTSSRDVLAQDFGVENFVNVVLHTPRYNIAPSQYVEAIIRGKEEQKRLRAAKVGVRALGCEHNDTRTDQRPLRNDRHRVPLP